MERKLRETRELAERNNEILQKLYRSMMWSRVMWVLYLVIIIGIAIGAFYFLEPYWDTVMEAYDSVRGQIQFSTPQG